MPRCKRQQGLYLPVEMLDEIEAVATRLDRSVSWVVQLAWKFARGEIARMPGVEDLPGRRGDARTGRPAGSPPHSAPSARVRASQHHHRPEDDRPAAEPRERHPFAEYDRRQEEREGWLDGGVDGGVYGP